MILTPMEIHNKKFNVKMRGYDKDQVDSFLDRIVDVYGDSLDKIVDLENEKVKLQKQVDKYTQIKESLNESLIDAQNTATNVKEKAEKQAKKILAEAKTTAAEKNRQLTDQTTSLQNDYELLKGKVADFRDQTKHLLETQLKQLDDQNWQYYLDQYYGRERLYPADGSEPVAPDRKPSVDNEAVSDVKSKQLDTAQILVGDAQSQETVSQPAVSGKQDGPVIIFPDDYKDHK